MYGYANPNFGSAVGVYGRADGPDSFGVVANAYYDGVGLSAWSYYGNLIEAYDGRFPSGELRFYIDQTGNVNADGAFISFKTSNLDGEAHALTSLQSTEIWLEDFGRASLVDGAAVVSITPDFAGVANLSVDYLVFVTPVGDCQGVYVTNKNPTSFEVREVNGGTSTVAFSYRIVAKQPGSETVRLPEVTIPEPVDVPRQPEEVTQPLEPQQPSQLPQEPQP